METVIDKPSPEAAARPAIPEYVQRMVAATNGRMYCGLIGRLDRYPIPMIPVPPSRGRGLLLDIGCGWGRWMAAAARKGYVPVGVDVKLEAARAALQVLRSLGAPGYVVVADLGRLPFGDEVFETVWSFSTLQHVHREKARECLRQVRRCLSPGGACVMEFPLRNGLWNRLQSSRRAHEDVNDPESWCVRYYSVRELRELFRDGFDAFRFWSHCYFGIGLLPVDLAFVPWKYKAVVLASMALSTVANLFPPLKYVSDSVFVCGRKSGTRPATAAAELHGDDNLAVVPLLRCPVSGGTLTLDAGRQRLVCAASGLAYPVVESIPVLLEKEAVKV